MSSNLYREAHPLATKQTPKVAFARIVPISTEKPILLLHGLPIVIAASSSGSNLYREAHPLATQVVQGVAETIKGGSNLYREAHPLATAEE